VYVPPGQSRVLTAPKPIVGLAAEQLKLTGDDEDFDNTVYVVPPKPEKIKVLFLASDAERDPTQSLYYLRRAFQETRRQIVEVIARPANAPVSAEDLATAPLLIIADPLASEAVKATRAFLEAGKPVLFAVKSAGAARQPVGPPLEVRPAAVLAAGFERRGEGATGSIRRGRCGVTGGDEPGAAVHPAHTRRHGSPRAWRQSVFRHGAAGHLHGDRR